MIIIDKIQAWAAGVIHVLAAVHNEAVEHWAYVLLGTLALVLAWLVLGRSRPVLALRSILSDENCVRVVPPRIDSRVVPHRDYAEPDRLRYLLDSPEAASLLITDEQALAEAEHLLRKYEPPLNDWMFREH